MSRKTYRCPYGLELGVDFDSHKDCHRCQGITRDSYKICEYAHHTTARVRADTLHTFARICLNITFDDFVRVIYGGTYKSPARKRYLAAKFKIWENSPLKLVCQLDVKNLRSLAAYIQNRLPGGL